MPFNNNSNTNGKNISGRNSSLRTRASRTTAGLTSTCPQAEVTDHLATLGVTYGQQVNCPQPLFAFYNYLYRSIATQIPHEFVLAFIQWHGTSSK